MYPMNDRQRWQLAANNAVRAGQPIPLPEIDLCEMSHQETALWRAAVQRAILSCSELPPLPSEWKGRYTPPFTQDARAAAEAALLAHRSARPAR
jgi:hypothetical protein